MDFCLITCTETILWVQGRRFNTKYLTRSTGKKNPWQGKSKCGLQHLITVISKKWIWMSCFKQSHPNQVPAKLWLQWAWHRSLLLSSTMGVLWGTQNVLDSAQTITKNRQSLRTETPWQPRLWHQATKKLPVLPAGPLAVPCQDCPLPTPTGKSLPCCGLC